MSALDVQPVAEEGAEASRVGVAADGCLESINGFFVPAESQQDKGEVRLAGEGSRVGVHGPPELLGGLLQPAGRSQRRPESEVAEGRPRANRHRRLKVSDRLRR